MTSFTCSSGDVRACSSFIMNGTFEVILARAWSVIPNGYFNLNLNVLLSTISSFCAAAISCFPKPSLAPHRFIEATQSLEVTAVPSCHFNPSRRVKVYKRPSSLIE